MLLQELFRTKKKKFKAAAQTGIRTLSELNKL